MRANSSTTQSVRISLKARPYAGACARRPIEPTHAGLGQACRPELDFVVLEHDAGTTLEQRQGFIKSLL